MTNNKIFAIGDIHGSISGLKQVLELSKFDYNKDTLIVLGDVADGHPYVKECVEELLKIINLIFIRGNHDQFFLDFINNDDRKNLWIQQGGNNTLKSYGLNYDSNKLLTPYMYGNCEKELSGVIVPEHHKEFFRNSIPYFIYDKKLFVHGGIDPSKDIGNQDFSFMMWDRDLIKYCKHGNQIMQFDEVFIGHSTTQMYNGTVPLHYENLWLLDTGCGWDGKLTIINIDSKQYWQSDSQISER